MNKNTVNSYALDEIGKYLNLEIYGFQVRCPYYINRIQNDVCVLLRGMKISEEKISEFCELYKNNNLLHGWYRGKGKPEEIVSATKTISKKADFLINKTSSDYIREFMILFGLGIDCSGFVYNVLAFALRQIGGEKEFIESLDWKDKKNTVVSKAGAFVFGGDASVEIQPEEIEPLDLILIKSKGGIYQHIALIVKRDGRLCVAQSNVGVVPFGVYVHGLNIRQNKPTFDYKPLGEESWENFYKKGQLEFRRLKILM